MIKRFLIFVWLVSFALCTSASKLPIYLNRCQVCSDTFGNVIKRSPAKPLCIWQEQNCIYIPQGEYMQCRLIDSDGVVYECMASETGTIVFPVELHGQYELLLQMDDVSYIGVLNL